MRNVTVDRVADVLPETDALVCLLPLTDATRGFVAAPLLEHLKHGAAFINGGRGEHVVEDDLLAALDSGAPPLPVARPCKGSRAERQRLLRMLQNETINSCIRRCTCGRGRVCLHVHASGSAAGGPLAPRAVHATCAARKAPSARIRSVEHSEPRASVCCPGWWVACRGAQMHSYGRHPWRRPGRVRHWHGCRRRMHVYMIT